MCIIITNADGKQLDKQTIDTVLRQNPDGVGFYCLKTGKLRKTLDNKQAAKWLASDTPFIAHCRYATHGEVSIHNVHPFPFGDGMLLAMNGTIDGYADSEANDTRQLVAQLKHVKKRDIAQFLECFAARFVLIDTKTGEVTRVGEWVERDGVYYSNSRPLTPQPAGNYVAVYGTLRYGFGNHEAYLKDAQFIDYAETTSPHRLCIDGLPYLLRGEDWNNGEFVEVEVYDVTDEQLADLDRLEGHPHHYCRERVNVTLERDGTQLDVWIYTVDEQYDNGEYHSYYSDNWEEDYFEPVCG